MGGTLTGRAGQEVHGTPGAADGSSLRSEKRAARNERGPAGGNASAGQALLDVRRLAAIDMHGRRGSKRRRRLVLAEFVLAAIEAPLLGLAIFLAASSTPQAMFGACLAGIGLNFVPLALHAISMSRAGRLDAELAGVDVGAELRRYTAKQLLVGIPMLVLILGAMQAVAAGARHQEPGRPRNGS